jgi:hypothetical protein
MKNYFLKITALVLFTGAMVSCDEDKIVYNVDNGQSLVGFVESDAEIPAMPADETEFVYEIEVGTTNRVNYDRTVTLSINEEATTALPSDYTIDAPATWVIPAGQFTSKIKVKTNYDAIGTNEKLLVFDLVSVQDQNNVDPFKTRIALTLYRWCPKEIAAAYVGSVITSGLEGDSYDVVPAATGNLNEYIVKNMWGDLVATATGSAQYKGQYPYNASFKIKCDNTVVVTGISNYASGGTGTFDEATKRINLTLNQGVFQDAFTVSVQFEPVD